jgi:hypothetical protein
MPVAIRSIGRAEGNALILDAMKCKIANILSSDHPLIRSRLTQDLNVREYIDGLMYFFMELKAANISTLSAEDAQPLEAEISRLSNFEDLAVAALQGCDEILDNGGENLVQAIGLRILTYFHENVAPVVAEVLAKDPNNSQLTREVLELRADYGILRSRTKFGSERFGLRLGVAWTDLLLNRWVEENGNSEVSMGRYRTVVPSVAPAPAPAPLVPVVAPAPLQPEAAQGEPAPAPVQSEAVQRQPDDRPGHAPLRQGETAPPIVEDPSNGIEEAQHEGPGHVVPVLESQNRSGWQKFLEGIKKIGQWFAKLFEGAGDAYVAVAVANAPVAHLREDIYEQVYGSSRRKLSTGQTQVGADEIKKHEALTAEHSGRGFGDETVVQLEGGRVEDLVTPDVGVHVEVNKTI